MSSASSRGSFGLRFSTKSVEESRGYLWDIFLGREVSWRIDFQELETKQSREEERLRFCSWRGNERANSEQETCVGR